MSQGRCWLVAADLFWMRCLPESNDPGGQKKHIGLYPGPEAVKQFSDKLDKAGCRYSKGAIQIPYSDELPLKLIAEIAAWCRETGNHA